MLKDKGGLDAGWCRAFGLAAQTIRALALAIVHNLKELKREAKRELKRLLIRQKRNGITLDPSHNGTGTVQHPNGAVSHLPPGTELNEDHLQALRESADFGSAGTPALLR